MPDQLAAPLPPAPGADSYVALDFANSVIALPGGQYVDLLGSPASVNAWLSAHALAPEDADVQELCATQLRALREHIRSLFTARATDVPALPAAVNAVNDALTLVPTTALLRWDDKTGPYRATPCPTNAILDHALATLAANAADLLTAPEADLLTPCTATPCNRYLLRHGRAHWCSTRCGNRARAARSYARRTSQSPQ
ncbi:CGNR zinc finger domain-containing protein [Kribbella solani]|uniref:Putative RNA-binding Zn ribbon-like protein n=1 Tax=Kribbella solani TaxID=236067 RepID=A0A841DKB8_9ACTN|nr:ABATE domain-containing protein [Kribbella solani]MBB5978079.1 putative RNA-binding Zn ribbon-like protein [Kribbella solani]